MPVFNANRRACALATALLMASPWAMSDPVLLDLYRGTAFVPGLPALPAGTSTYNNNAAPGSLADRMAAVQRLVTFGSDPANIATPLTFGGIPSVLPSSWPSFNVPTGSNVLCESPVSPGTNGACQNKIQGAFMYTALLMPAAGTYVFSCTGNDGTLMNSSPAQGTAYRDLGYATAVSANGCTLSASPTTGAPNPAGYGTGTIVTTAPNTLVNVRLAWNNWGNDAIHNLVWIAPGTTSLVAIPAAQLYDPSAPATYLTAADDAFAAPIVGGTGGTTPTVAANDLFNVATPVTQGDGTPNISGISYALINDPVTLAPPPAGVSFGSSGALTIAATVPAGTHSVSYQICRTDTVPSPLCAVAKATFTVSAFPIPPITVTPVPAAVPPAPVPTLGEWALAMLSVLMLAFGLRTRKHLSQP